MNAQNLKLYIKAITDFSDVQSNVKNVQEVINRLKLPDNLKNSFAGVFSGLEKETEKYQKLLNSGFKNKKDVTGLEQSGEKISQLLTKLHTQMSKISPDMLKNVFNIDPSTIIQAENHIKNIKAQIEQITLSSNFQNQIKIVNTEIGKLGTKSKFADEFKKAFAVGDIQKASAALSQLTKNHKAFKNNTKELAWNQQIQILEGHLRSLQSNTALQTLNQQLSQAKINLANIGVTEFNKLITSFQNGTNSVEKANVQFKNFNATQVQTAQNAQRLSSELETLKYQTTYFFGLANSVNLFKRALRSAYETVKELDAAMTATAVVTDFTVSDMWGQLPEYTKRANELGVAVKGAYEAATLYYQQGLKTDQVVAVSNETLKMARIAGMDYAEATDSMTAALRGFNMEVNEISAQKVNDVYSKLAAITASDTQEISTAMSKTASIAASANMEFETTAAFLSQIIETTREAPETAGTALKTVIARFQELKKQPSEIGEVEGEIVDANKIETALRTIDVALRDTNGQFRALDDVFLDIAEKWDDLDTNTQRYIATMAAGSRQQSRFIAMMSDYDRTMELVSAANNSAGASQAQFEKTLDSLESKLAKLDNAWNEFTMGIANNAAIKTGVDLLTLLLNTINNITGILPNGIDSFAKLGITFLGLRTGLKIFDNFWLNMKNGIPPVTAATKAATTSLSGLRNVFSSKVWRGDNLYTDVLAYTKTLPAAYSATQKQIMTLQHLAYNYGLTSAQTQSFIYLQRSGIPVETALTMAVKGYTEAQLEADAAKLAGANASAQEIATAKKEVIANFEVAHAEDIRQYKQKKGIILSTKDKLASIGNTIAKKLHIKALQSENAQLFINNGLKTKQALLTLGTVAAVVGLIFVMKKLYDVMKDNTPEARIKKLQESIEDSEEAAKSAKDAYENLFSAKTEYEDIQDKLDGLVKGTKEWEQALFEANNQVLELINSYDNLQVKNNNGRLEIVNWDDVLEQQKERIANTTVSASIANLELKGEEARQAKVGIQTPINAYTDETKENLVKDFDTGKLAEALAGGVESAAYQEVLQKYKITIDELKDLIPKIQDYKNSLTGLTNASDNLANTLAANLSEEVKDSEYASSVTRKFAELQTKDQTQDIQERKNELDRKYITSELQKLYKEVSGQEADSEWKQDKLAEEIAKLQISQEYLNSTEELIETLDNVSTTNKDAAAIAEGLLSDGLSLRRSDLDLDATDYTKELESIIKILEPLGLDFSNFKTIQENAAESFNKSVTKLINSTGSSGIMAANYASTNILSDATLGQYQGYMTQLEGIIVRGLAEGGTEGGRTAGEQFNSQIQSILSKAPADMKDKILNIVGTTDFSTVSGIKQFVKDVQTLGMEIPFDEAKNLTKEFTELANATNDIDLSTLIDQIKTLRDIADEIRDTELSEGISEETYNALLEQNAINPEEFYWTGQEYIYLGNSMDELAISIDNLTKEMAEGRVKELEDRLANANNFENRLNNAKEANVASLIIEGGMDDFLSGNATTSTIKEVLGLDGTAEEVRAVYKTWLQDYLEKGDIESQLNTGRTNLAQADMHGMSAAEIQASGYSPEQINNALKAKVATEELGGEYARLKRTFKQTNKEISENEILMIDLASAVKKSSVNYGALNNIIKDNEEILKNPEKDLGAYGTAVSDIAEKASIAFGTVVDTDFVEENIQKFLDIAKGGEAAKTAYKTLGKKLAIGLAEGFDEANPKQFIEDLITQLDGLSFDIYGNFDPTAIYQQFVKTAEEAEKLQALLSSIGFDTSFDFWYTYEKDGRVGYAKSAEGQKYLEDAGYVQTGIKIVGASGTKIDRTSFGNTAKKETGSASEWENPYDEQYNTLEKINEALRDREELEKDYQLLQKKGIVNGKDALNYYNAIFANLKKQADLQKTLIAGRQKELTNLLAENPSMTQYAKYDESSGLIEIQYELIDAIKKSDEKTGEAVEKFISELERISESIEDAQDELIEIENNQEDIKDQLVDTYLAFEDRVAAALEAIDQKQVDLLQEEFDALTEAEESLADAIGKSIDEMRQARENEKTEEEIAEKERRLAYLRQDTTGSNALEIKRLEEEIAEQREDYQYAIIEQSLTNMQEQNELAAEQRDKQIELMQSQIEYNVETGVYAKQVAGLIESAMEGDHMLTEDDELYDILNDGENWRALSVEGFKAMFEELAAQISDAYAAMTSDFGAFGGESGSSSAGSDNYMQQMMDLYAMSDGKPSEEVWEKIYSLNEKRNDKIEDPNYKGAQTTLGKGELKKLLENWYDDDMDPSYGDTSPGKVSSGGGSSSNNNHTNNAQYAYPQEGDTVRTFTNRHGISANKLKELNPSRVKTTSATAELDPSWRLRIYKTGGLADFTGPAWLDGSKNKPELVLNARDTENFIVLKDVLSSLLHNTPTNNSNGGDNYFDITIQVEEISNDYDVDQMAARIKQNIYEDSMYRNVNAVNFLR